MTLAEMMVSLGLLLIIMGMVLAVYIAGVKVWRKGGTRSELLQDLQVATSNMANDLARTSYASVSIGPGNDSIAVLTLFDDDGNFAMNSAGDPIWDRWVIYSRQSDTLVRSEVAWPATPDIRATPIPIEQLSPPLTIVDYVATGRVIARDIYDFEVLVVPDTTSISLKLHLLKQVPQAPPERVRVDTVIATRN